MLHSNKSPVPHIPRAAGLMRVALSPTALTATTLAAVLLFGIAAHGQREDNATPSGERVYLLYCSGCHGHDGHGTPKGTPLVGEATRNKSDSALRSAILNGVVDRGMMPFGGRLSREEVNAVLDYVRTLQGLRAQRRREEPPAAAQALRERDAVVRLGEEVFNGIARCIQCHSYDDRGGVIGPKLDRVASRLGLEGIRTAVLTPSQTVAPGYEAVEIVTADGNTIRGRYRRETDETIQVLDETGTLWTTYFKDDLRSVIKVDESLMPENLLDPLTETESQALLNFLTSLR